MSYKSVLRFGIDTLDELLAGKGNGGINFESDKGHPYPTSLCLAGPDGTGKSVLAMHLAAFYAADRPQNLPAPKILYISTDLKAGKAESIWKNFLLDQPSSKPSVFTKEWFKREPLGHSEAIIGKDYVHFQPYQPFSPEFAQYLCEPSNIPSVAFVDLASDTAGDDWAFLNRTLSVLDSGTTGSSPHLLIVDAVEGLEAFAGSLNIYGQEGDRRAHVAQLMRTAGSKCHIVLVVEEADDKLRLPEDYVTDVVLRLRNITHDAGGRSYLRRTIEVEKARAQTHVRGQHVMLIRDGKGSYTGSKEPRNANPDNPPMRVAFRREPVPVGAHRSGRDEGEIQISYVHVVHSLDYQSRSLMRDETVALSDTDESPGRAGFGIHYLDQVLSARPEGTEYENRTSDSRGLPWSTLTSVVGEHGTHRNRLIHAFLSQCFAHERCDHVAVLISTGDIDADRLANKLSKHFEKPHEGASPWHKRIVCRRLEAHDLSPSALFHVVVCAIRQAQAILDRHDSGTCAVAGRIRLGITNLDAMKEMYPGTVDDPLLLPALRLWLAREHITTVLVQTDGAGPDRSKQSPLTQVICGSSRHTIYTWHVPFFGELRVAIAAIPPITDDTTPTVRELRPADVKNEERLHVDPHFELYEGILERTEVKLVPLQVRLWGREAHFESHVASLDATFREVFGTGPSERCVVLPGKDISYDDLRSATHLKGNMRLDHTLVLQIDEFWHAHHRELKRMEPYLFGFTTRSNRPVTDNDPYLVFQNTKNIISTNEIARDRASAVDTLRMQAMATLSELIEKFDKISNLSGPPESVQDEEGTEQKLHLETKTDGKEYLKAEVEILSRLANEVLDKYEESLHINAKQERNELRQLKATMIAILRTARRIEKLDNSDRLRVEFYRSPSNHYYLARTLHPIDRVPYFWDFGFMMMRRSLWQAARHKEFVWKYPATKETEEPEYAIVGEIFNRLVLDNGETNFLTLIEESSKGVAADHTNAKANTSNLPPVISWRIFLQACSVVARTAGVEEDGHVFSFDVDMVGPESFCCFVLEVWFSVIAELHTDFLSPGDQCAFAMKRNEPMKDGLDVLLVKYLPEFYLTWLLLGEVLSANQLGIDLFTPKIRRAKTTAVASRHWYASAAGIQPIESTDERLVPGKLPGHFSVRGDWFLAIAAGSRSGLLGERAIDILSTRKSSLNRLKEGIGLPVRDFSDKETSKAAPTRIAVRDRKNRIRQLTYDDLLSLGAESQLSGNFFWLWRYTMRDYDRQSGVFLQMISAVLKKAPVYWDHLLKEDHDDTGTQNNRPHIRSGFEAFDLLKHSLQQQEKLDGRHSYEIFKADIDAWIRRLHDSALGFEEDA